MANNQKEYIVGLKKKNDPTDYDATWALLENITTGISYIPDDALEIKNVKPGSLRLCHYMMTDDQAELLRQHPDVEVVEIPLQHRQDVEIRLGAVQEGNFNKITSSSGPYKNWGLIRHSVGSEAYGTGSNTSYNYDYTMDGTGVDVVINDTGIETSHPEFTDADGVSRIQEIDWYEEAGVSGSQPPGLYSDDNGHGTHVAGIAAGKTFGWAKNARIYVMPVDGLSPNGVQLDVMFDLIKLWHRNKPVNPDTGVKRPTVVNMSWGFYFNRGSTPFSGVYRGTVVSPLDSTHGFNSVISIRSAAVDIDIQEMIDEGIIVCIAAGNNYSKVDAPGGIDYDNTFTAYGDVYHYHRGASPHSDDAIKVGALSNTYSSGEQKAYFSNAGPGVKVFAAGHYVMSAWISDPLSMGPSPYYEDNSYMQYNISGTSMASPQICGIAALYLQLYPDSTPAQVSDWIYNQADTSLYVTGNDNDYSDNTSQWGGNAVIVKAYSLVEVLETMPKNLKNGVRLTANFSKVKQIEITNSNSPQYIYLTPGQYKIRVPSNATTMNALLIGGGGGGAGGTGGALSRPGGAGGGALRWSYNIPVSRNEWLFVNVPAGGTGGSGSTRGNNGGTAYVARGGDMILYAEGGKGGRVGTNGKGGEGSRLGTHRWVSRLYNANHPDQYASGNLFDLTGKIMAPGHTFQDGDIVLFRGKNWFETYNWAESPSCYFQQYGNNGLLQNDLYFIHQSDSEGFRLQHYGRNIPGWSEDLYGLFLAPDYVSLPYEDYVFDNVTFGPVGVYDPDGPVDIPYHYQDTYPGLIAQYYDMFYHVNEVKNYGIGLLEIQEVTGFLGEFIGYRYIFGPIWELDFNKTFGGNGGDGGYDYVSYNNFYSSWYHSGGGGGAGGYGTTVIPYKLSSKLASIDPRAFANRPSRWTYQRELYDTASAYGYPAFDMTKTSDGGNGYMGINIPSSGWTRVSGMGYGGDGGKAGKAAGGGGGVGADYFDDIRVAYQTRGPKAYEWNTDYMSDPEQSGISIGDTGVGGSLHFGIQAGITSPSVTIQQSDGIDHFTITSAGSDYFPAARITVIPRMYYINSSDFNSSTKRITIPDHGYSQNELVGINTYVFDGSTTISGSNYFVYNGTPVAGYTTLTYPYSDGSYNKNIDTAAPAGTTSYNYSLTPGSSTGQVYPLPYYTMFFKVNVIDANTITIVGQSGSLASITGTVKIFNAEYWNWVRTTSTSHPDTGAMTAVTVNNQSGTLGYNVGYKGSNGEYSYYVHIAENNGAGLALTPVFKSNVGQVQSYAYTSSLGHFEPSTVEIYKTGVYTPFSKRLTYSANDSSVSEADQYITTSVSENKLVVTIDIASITLSNYYTYSLRIKTAGKLLSNGTGADGTTVTGTYFGGNGGNFGGGGGGGFNYGGNGGDGVVLLSFKTDHKFPSINLRFEEYDNSEIETVPIIDIDGIKVTPVTDFTLVDSIALTLINDNDNEDPRGDTEDPRTVDPE